MAAAAASRQIAVITVALTRNAVVGNFARASGFCFCAIFDQSPEFADCRHAPAVFSARHNRFAIIFGVIKIFLVIFRRPHKPVYRGTFGNFRFAFFTACIPIVIGVAFARIGR